MRPTLALLSALSLCAACEVTAENAPPGLQDAVVLQTRPTHGWQVMESGRPAGFVLRFEEPGGARRFLYSVRDERNHDLGMVDAEGRAFRYRPHSEAEWVGTGTVLEGVRVILGLTPEAELEERDLKRLSVLVAEASARTR